jgi:hypothetical protein
MGPVLQDLLQCTACGYLRLVLLHGLLQGLITAAFGNILCCFAAQKLAAFEPMLLTPSDVSG